jgi:hypothetical protein
MLKEMPVAMPFLQSLNFFFQEGSFSHFVTSVFETEIVR